MGRQQSSIDLLPDEVRDQLNELLRDRRVTQKAAVEKINQISKSAVNRYDLQMREVGERLQQSREVADMWINKLGAQPQGQIGNLVNEILRSLSFDLSLKTTDIELDEENMPAVAGMLKDLALTTMRLEKASNLNIEREKEIRQQALQDAAATAEKITKQGGLSAETAEEIRNGILGIS